MTNSILTPTIFHEDWWLNAATNGAYEVAEVSNGSGQVVGRLPFYYMRKYGMKWGEMPTLTHFLGPAIDEGAGSINTRFTTRLEVTRALIEKLPPIDYIRIKCHRDVHDVIPFQEQKFKTSIQFTWEVQPLSEEALWANLRKEPRNAVRRAEKSLDIVPFDDPAAYIRFYKTNLDAKGMKSNIIMPVATKVIEACLERQRGRILVAKDKATGELHSGIFCAWDSTSVYYLLTTRTATANNGAGAALAWHTLKDAASRNLIFDLDGLATPGSIMFYAGFGGTVQPRYIAMKMSKPACAINFLRGLKNKEQYFY